MFTYFNLIFVSLAVCIILVGSYKDLTFMPIVFINMIIGIVQELRSRRMLRKMTFLTAPKATLIRGGVEITVPPEQAALDDVAVFAQGNQIYADAVVLDGECRVNEALVTGESDEIVKKPGDTLLSGSFVVAGSVRARLDKVGRDSFVAGLTVEAKKTGRKMRSEMMYALTRLVKTIGIVIVPFGILMMYQNVFVQHGTLEASVVTTVAAIIGMIPEGLYLLVSVALTVSVMRLAQRRTLVHEMRCIETLARVDTLCVDKTGTITEPEMHVRDVICLREEQFPSGAVTQIMADYLYGAPDGNETSAALERHFSAKPKRKAEARLPFTSANKYAGARFPDGTSYLLGAPEKMLAEDSAEHKQAEKHAEEGYRVLLLARYEGDIEAKRTDGLILPVALILLTNKIRDSAAPTFKFFADQGVFIRVISGDNPATVSRIAQDAGVADADKYIDASVLKTERQIRRAATEFTVFGRVTPDMKRRLIRAMRAEGHTVAMTGDGVNDVLALKDADCGIAMASGSEVASHVAQLVLLDSDFGAMPAVVMEGRRVINNIERSSSLFLVKNIFSFTVTLLALVFVMSFPMGVSQLTLYNVMFIGIPSVALALEPNHARVKGRFMVNVLLNALPAGLTDLAAVMTLMQLGERYGIPTVEISTMTTIAISFVGFLMLLKVSRPLNTLRLALIIAMPIGFAIGAIFFPALFAMSALSGRSVFMLLTVCAVSAPVMLALAAGARKVRGEYIKRGHGGKRRANGRIKV